MQTAPICLLDNKFSLHQDLLFELAAWQNPAFSFPSYSFHRLSWPKPSFLAPVFSARVSVVASHLHRTCPLWRGLSTLWPLCWEQDILSEEKQEQSFEMNPFKGHLV